MKGKSLRIGLALALATSLTARLAAITPTGGTETLTKPIAAADQPASSARIAPMKKPVVAGQAEEFSAAPSVGKIEEYRWDFGDGGHGTGRKVRHAFSTPGVYRMTLTTASGDSTDTCLALVRAQSEQTLSVPQVLLDTDAKNEQDDQYYLGYALFSDLTILGINSTHHGGGQEATNYAEIRNVIDLARKSGLPEQRVPIVFRGADRRLAVPESGVWSDTEPIVTPASEAILAAARGAAPGHPVWIVPVGPGTNPASAVLQAWSEGLDLKGRVRFMWLGGSDGAVTGEFNGNNDPWSIHVLGQSGVEMWVMPAPVGARVTVNKEREGYLYADNPLGQYLKEIVPAGDKPLFDPATLSAIISEHLGLGWVTRTEPVRVGGPDDGYRWIKADGKASVRVIREINAKAMQRDIFETMKDRATPLIGRK